MILFPVTGQVAVIPNNVQNSTPKRQRAPRIGGLTEYTLGHEMVPHQQLVEFQNLERLCRGYETPFIGNLSVAQVCHQL